MKIYKKYRQQQSLGVISSGEVLSMGDECVSSALTDVIKWNVKQATSSVLLPGDKLVTSMAKFGDLLAIGYGDGSIRLLGKEMVVLNGHRSAVTALSFDMNGTRLASGSTDTDIVLWDVVSEEGMHRFKGHKDQVTCVSFIEETSSGDGVNHLISGSKDSIIKVWDIGAKCCVENIVLHRGEVWSLAINGSTLLTGASDGLLRVWSIDFQVLGSKFNEEVDIGSENPEIKKAIVFLGVLERHNKEKILSIRYHPSGDYFGVQGAEKVLEIFKIKSETEILKSIKKRNKRMLKKDAESTVSTEITLSDKIALFNIVRYSAKLKSFDFFDGIRNNHIRVMAGLSNNIIEIYELDLEESKTPARHVSSIDLPGHRSDIRAVALNEDDQLILSGSSDRIKIYSSTTGSCLQTMDSGYVLCCTFLPGSKHVIVGTKAGELQIYELSSSTLIETISAHDGAVWSLQVLPDKLGLVTGGQDKQVKFWKFLMIDDSDYSKMNKRLSLAHTKTLKLSDDVLSIKVSPDGRLLAVALLDLTVKIFFTDTLKFSLSLYGHKLPVIALDISFDSKIIITASSDKTVKIWGLDFGDCHKSILAHEDAIMACQFVWGTYYFFTASKDKSIKYFDGEKFEEISRLEGHQGEVWSIAVGKYGNIVVSGSHDKSTRIWEKTDEQFVLSEEREDRLEKLYEAMDLDNDRVQQQIGSKADGVEETEEENVNEAATRATTESLKSGELLAESLNVWKQENQDLIKYLEISKTNPEAAKPTRNAFTLQMDMSEVPPDECVLKVANQIRSSHLNDALMTLPFGQVILMIQCVTEWIQKQLDPIQSSRILLFLLKTHHNEIVSNRALKPYLEKIRTVNRTSLKESRDKIGFNLYGMQALLREHSSQQIAYFPSSDEPVLEVHSGLKRKVTVS